MDMFYKKKNCERCGLDFKDSILRIQSWFNDDVICSTLCNLEEKKILKSLGDKKYEFENCGFIPQLSNDNQLVHELSRV